MNVVLVLLIKLINLIKDHKLIASLASGTAAMALIGLSFASLAGNSHSTAAGQQLVTGDGNATTLSAIPSGGAAKEKPAEKPAATTSGAQKPADTKGQESTAGPAGTSTTVTPQVTIAPAAGTSATTDKPQSDSSATQSGGSSAASGAATGSTTPGFSVAFNDSATYKDKSANTIYGKYVVTQDAGFSGSLTASVAASGNGVTCSLSANNTVEMKLDPVLPADYYGCKLSVTDGKVTKTADLVIHHAGGATN